MRADQRLCSRRDVRILQSRRSAPERRSSLHNTFVRKPFRKAFNAEEEAAVPEEEEEEEADEPEGEDELYACVTVLQEEEYKDVDDQIEQDVVTCFVCAGADLLDEEVCEQISDCVHDEMFGFYSREEARQNGVPVCTTRSFVNRSGRHSMPKKKQQFLKRKKKKKRTSLKAKTNCTLA